MFFLNSLYGLNCLVDVLGWVEIVRALEGFLVSLRVYEIITGKKSPQLRGLVRGKGFNYLSNSRSSFNQSTRFFINLSCFRQCP